MPTLIIHAPHSEVQQNQKQSFDQTLATQKGDGYAISSSLFKRLSPGDGITVICKAHKKQASGLIKSLNPTVKAGNGIQRYDVILSNMKRVAYTHGNTRLNRNGVAVI